MKTGKSETLNTYIFNQFMDGQRINIESFRKFGDYNVYKDCKLVRIYYVHRFKKSWPIDIIAKEISELFCQDETQIISEIINFICSYPNFWDFRDSLEYKISTGNYFEDENR